MSDTLLDIAHERINAIGGSASSDYDRGINDAVGKALAIIEELGGCDPLMLWAEKAGDRGMKNPMHVNLQTPEEIRAAGWGGESRDADGHLIRCHIPFECDEDIIRFVREGLEHSETITIWRAEEPSNDR